MESGCFGFCDCLLGEEQPVAGTFLLVDLDETAKFREFAVVDVQLALDLFVGREPLTHYDSGLVAPTTRFPAT